MKLTSSLSILIFGSLQLVVCSGNIVDSYDNDYSETGNLRRRDLSSEAADDPEGTDVFSHSALEALIMEEIEAEELTDEEIIQVQTILNKGHAEEEYNDYYGEQDAGDEEEHRELRPYGYASRRVVRPGQSSNFGASSRIRAYPNFSYNRVTPPLPQPQLPVANDPPPPPKKKAPPRKKAPPKKKAAFKKQGPSPGFRPPRSFSQGIGFVGVDDAGAPVVVIPATPGNALSSSLGYFRVNIGGQPVVLVVQPSTPTLSPVDAAAAIPIEPTISPRPTHDPTRQPTRQPTINPTRNPTKPPTFAPTKQPTRSPTFAPTSKPTKRPTPIPTVKPTLRPTAKPTLVPTKNPTATPTKFPTFQPTVSPTNNPTRQPTKNPTSNPTRRPTQQPTTSF
mmetsp:Transcript_23069/g.63961  ORF Transcript_23069/g.63961 Transcript_23069/m.63961 type:complete len:392 (-) Transcript_23069:312-1487(-)|eukprot:CAMPEP_0172359878 /NCGR_PEP_ID=MMETSP1060-20121228/3992_1 /TAXON_ID=37318 /ORGANISM="Pseudo-nitzschia pungens, Strain cf. cingulata" /LENGTH=391 /DNA_ID=CAMNT_0013081691 /DNA_START=351 /DNA_END=1526 /DNA_ORIENTATION=+